MKSVLSFSLLVIFILACSPKYRSERERAEALVQEEKYVEAIEAYTLHMKQRGESKSKPPEENPSFYFLMIGDLYLQQENPDAALESYLRAKTDGVSPGLVSERIRRLAAWHALHRRTEQAFEILEKYRELDPLLYDADADSLHKSLIEQLDHPSTPTNTESFP